jgi:hypothetical protein
VEEIAQQIRAQGMACSATHSLCVYALLLASGTFFSPFALPAINFLFHFFFSIEQSSSSFRLPLVLSFCPPTMSPLLSQLQPPPFCCWSFPFARSSTPLPSSQTSRLVVVVNAFVPVKFRLSQRYLDQ